MLKISTQHLLYEENMIYWAKTNYWLFGVNLWQTRAGLKKLSQREVCKLKETIQLCKIISPLPYYSFHETPGDIVHTLLTAFPPLLFLCYPFPSLQHSSPGGNTHKSYIYKGCQSWLLDNCQRARGPSPAFQVGLVQVVSRGHWPTRQCSGISLLRAAQGAHTHTAYTALL